jgi:hypothetical protein
MSRVAQPATAINPPSEPPAASQRVAAVCRNRCGWNRSIPASRDRYFSAACSPSYEKPLPRSPTHSSGLSARRCPRRIRTYRSIAVAVCAPKGTMRPLPPLPRRTVATPRGRSTSDTFKPTTSPARIPVSAINRTMASSRRSRSPLPAHALIHAFSSVSVSASVTLVSSLGGLTPSRGSVSNSPSSVSHAAKRLSASWRERAVDGSALTGSAVLVYISLE